MHSGVHGPALTYPRFSKQKVMPPSPTIISPAFNRSRMVPFYERSQEINPNWVLIPIRRTDEKGDSQRSDAKRNVFLFALHINSIFHTTCSPRACLHLREKDRLPHLLFPHYFSNGLLFRGVSQKSAASWCTNNLSNTSELAYLGVCCI